MSIKTEDTPLGTHILLVGDIEDKEKYIKCVKCGGKAYPKNCKSRWELYSPRFKNFCYDCFKKEMNNNLTDEFIKLYAEDYLENGNFYSQGRRDLTEDNFNKFVEPVIKKMQEEKEKAAQEQYHQEKLAEAQKIIDDINKKGALSLEDREKEIIASLLKKMDELIEGQSYRPEPIFR